MRIPGLPSSSTLRRNACLLVCGLVLSISIFPPAPPLQASAYNGRPRLVVVIVIDQFRGDYLARYHDQFGANGFRMLTDRGANFLECYYDYANTHTAPGHATLFTGAYSNGHGIIGNEWYDPARKKMVTSVQDETTRLVGLPPEAPPAPGASPRTLLASTLGDEMKLATAGKSRVFAISLKDRAAILPGGFAADAAYWIDRQSGAFLTSSYYMTKLPAWVEEFNRQKRAQKYLNLEWKDAAGHLLRSTRAPLTSGAASGSSAFYDVAGSTPYANDYELEFARELISREQLGSGPATDLISISLSANDILGHEVGPDSPQMAAMALALDHQLEDFFAFLGRQAGLANVWIALSADHGMAPMPEHAAQLRLPASRLDWAQARGRANALLAAKLGRGDYIKGAAWPIVYLSEDAFAAAGLGEADAERAVGDAFLLKQLKLRGYYTRAQLKDGNLPRTAEGRRYANSYAAAATWYVMLVPSPFVVAFSEPKYAATADHSTQYSYDTHVPLAFFGLPFQPGAYRKSAQPTDLAVTLASLLGINPPTHAVGRVLTEALAPPAGPASGSPPDATGSGERRENAAVPGSMPALHRNVRARPGETASAATTGESARGPDR